MKEIFIDTEYINLMQLLKLTGVAQSGSEAKFLIDDGQVMVNNEIEFQKRKKLYENFIVRYEDKEFIIKEVHKDDN